MYSVYFQHPIQVPSSNEQLMDTCAIKPLQRRVEGRHNGREAILVGDRISLDVKLHQVHGFEEEYGVPEVLHVDVFLSALLEGFTPFDFVRKRR